MKVFDALCASGAFTPADRFLALGLEEIASAGPPDDLVLVAVAAASRAVRGGEVAADLGRLANQPIVNEDGSGTEARWPDLEPWLEALGRSPLTEGPDCPLVIHHTHLFLRRYWDHQITIADTLRRRLAVAQTAPSAALEAALNTHFPPERAPTDASPDRQRQAAQMAATRPLAVISGGPGTGKTSTVVRLLGALVADRLESGTAPAVQLLAPTGKAAARMRQAVREGREGLEPAIQAHIPTSASTIHRALGAVPHTSRFRRGPDNPLPADIIVVDECSMIGMGLMRRLLDAIRTDATLILLGDRHQLSSVDPGAVFSELCATDAINDPMRAHAVHLSYSFRFDAKAGIGALSEAVRTGNVDRAVAALSSHQVRHVDTAAPDWERAFEHEVLGGYLPFLRAEPPADRLAALDRFRVLCAHRTGRFGVSALNQRIERILENEGLIHPNGNTWARRPVMVTTNSYRTGLFNGDVGVMVPDSARADAFRVWFPGDEDDAPRPFSTARLPPHETVFATTVHKSQGSEFDQVAIVLPDAGSPLLTRELLYTAITRARSAVSLYGTHEAIAEAINTKTSRSSTLKAQLRAPINQS